MTNAQIIFNESIELVKSGKIGTTGRVFTMETADGEEVTVQEPEPLHTFAHWKSLGRQVKKGEHAKAAFTIWKAGKGKTQEDGTQADGEKTENIKMFMKKAFFFTIDQTEPITAKA